MKEKNCDFRILIEVGNYCFPVFSSCFFFFAAFFFANEGIIFLLVNSSYAIIMKVPKSLPIKTP
jgi:hypothetical protein